MQHFIVYHFVSQKLSAVYLRSNLGTCRWSRQNGTGGIFLSLTEGNLTLWNSL